MRLSAKSALLALSIMSLSPALPAHAADKLPEPYVSRALDALLMPVTPAVISEFGLKSDVRGVMIIAVEPGGTAASQKLEPGDVIVSLEGAKLDHPLEVDQITGYWLNKGKTSLDYQYLRAGQIVKAPTVVTVEEFGEAIDLVTVKTWTAYSYSSSSWSYESYYSEYSEEITSSYSEATQSIEEASSSEEFSQEMEQAETADESGSTVDVGDEGGDDSSATDGDSGGDDGAADSNDGGDDGAADDGDAGGGGDEEEQQ